MSGQSGDINTQVLEYLEQKYGESFEYSAPTGDSITGTRAMLVRCESLPEAVYVEIENYRKADRVIRDNYIAIKYKQETIDFLDNCAAEEFCEANVFYSVTRSGLSPDLPPDASFDDFLKNSGVTLIGTIEVKSENSKYKNQVEKFAKRVAESGVQYRFMIAIMTPDEFGIYDLDEIGDMMVFGETKDRASVDYIDGTFEITWLGEEK